MVEKALHRVVSDKDVSEAVAVVVGERDSQSFAAGIGDTRLLRNVGEGAVAVIVIQNVGDAVIVVGMTVGTVAGLLLPAVAVGLETPIQVARNEDVELAVVVVIEEPGTRAPAAGCNTGCLGDIGKRAVSVVMVERVAAVSGHVDIFKAIVVVITDSHTHRVVVLLGSRQTCLLRHIGKGAIRILVIETVPELAVGLVRHFAAWHRVVNLGAVGEENVQAAIVVVVQKSYTSAHRLDEVFVGGRRVLVLEVNAESLGDVGELDFRSWCGGDQAAG